MAKPDIYKDVEYPQIRIAGVWYEKSEVEDIVYALAELVGLSIAER